jgi:hypothetical protein
MKSHTYFLVDGKEYLGYESSAAAIGSTAKSLTNLVWLREKEHGKFCVFNLRGHTVQRRRAPEATQGQPKTLKAEIEIVATDMAVTAMITPQELLALELRAVKEELRYLRECLVGRFHGLDEISEHIRSIEKRVIEEKHVRGAYHGGIANGAEKLG